MSAPAGAMQVQETWMRFDNFLISSLITNPNKVNGASSFANLAAMEEVGFFNVRTRSEVGGEYTNIENKNGVEFPMYVESVGIRFVCPSPLLTDLSPSGMAVAKMFCETIPEHSYIEFGVNQDVKLMLKPHMMPAGYGPQGMASYQQWLNASFMSVEAAGACVLGNRFQMIGDAIAVPANTPIFARLRFGPYAKLLLARMTLWDLDMLEGADLPSSDATTAAMASIEMSIRCVRLVQQRGELFAS